MDNEDQDNDRQENYDYTVDDSNSIRYFISRSHKRDMFDVDER